MSLRPFAGLYVPQCTPFGYFKVVQVHGSTGHSWCVNPETGAKVNSSDVAPGVGKPQCGKCFYDLAKFLGAGFVSVPGRVKPQCDENGLFSEKQHSGSTGYSWCVNPQTGEKIEGTEIAPGAGQANCGQANPGPAPEIGGAIGPCVNTETVQPGQFHAQCTPFGYYQVIQRHGSTGYRFCVDPETGVKIEGTEVGPAVQADPECGKCLYALLQFHGAGHVSIGRQRPSCDAQGKFNAKQSSGSSGYSWCVDPETGDKIEGTDVAPAAGEASCEAAASREKRQTLIGQFVPQKTIFGAYKVVQTHGSTGYSWCVNPETGVKIEGTEVAPASGTKPQCPQCLYALAKTLNAGPVGPVGMPRPQCDANGKYTEVQHSGSTGYSWCVDPETGVKIEGTETGPTAAPSCGTRQKRALVGGFVPQKTKFGAYKVIQTHGSTGYSWCVNPETGVKIEGTEVAPAAGAKPQCPQCLYALARTFLAGPVGPVGMFRPQCDANGKYTAVQHSGSTGYSWCVDPETGVKVEGTESSPAAGPASCAQRQKRQRPGPCHQQSGQPMIGAYVPQCTIFGTFKVNQVHASTGYSFCVNPETGVKIEGTDVAPASGAKLQCPKCLYALARTFLAGPVGPVGMPRPQCGADGKYTAVQHSGSTGYSWCVDPETGVKIEGTESSPAAGPATCGETRAKRAVAQCAQEVESVGDKAMPGYSKPQCTPKGNYELIQHHGSTGYTYCVNPDSGIKIDGTEVAPGENRIPICPSCATLLAQALQKILVGAYRPQCDITGQFKKLQISASTGFAWCADPVTGNKLPGTFQRYDGTQKCEAAPAVEEADDEPQGPCAAAAAATKPQLGAFRPVCDSRGNYASLQTHEGYRFCVDTNTGVQLPGSPSFGPADADKKLPCENN